jgi:hypothetical protein
MDRSFFQEVAMPKTTQRPQFSKHDELLTYLKEKPLMENFSVLSSEAISFHWANWAESCRFQKDYLFDNARSCERYFDFNQELEEFKKVPVWMKNREKTILSSLYDLYQCYSDSRIRTMWFERENEILISLCQESGPYVSLSSMRWMDKAIYSKFVHKKILTQPMPMRGFRLSSQIPMIATFESFPLKEAIFTIHQISEHGLLIQIKGRHLINLIEQSEHTYLTVNLKPFLDVSNAPVNDALKRLEKQDFYALNPELDRLTVLTMKPEVLDKYGNRDSFRLAANDEFYLFAKYRDLVNDSNSIRVKKVFKSLVKKLEEEFNEAIQKAA